MAPFIAALLLITNTCKEPKCSSTVDRDKYGKCESFILKNIIYLGKKESNLSYKNNQSERDNHSMIPLTWS